MKSDTYYKKIYKFVILSDMNMFSENICGDEFAVSYEVILA